MHVSGALSLNTAGVNLDCLEIREVAAEVGYMEF